MNRSQQFRPGKPNRSRHCSPNNQIHTIFRILTNAWSTIIEEALFKPCYRVNMWHTATNLTIKDTVKI